MLFVFSFEFKDKFISLKSVTSGMKYIYNKIEISLFIKYWSEIRSMNVRKGEQVGHEHLPSWDLVKHYNFQKLHWN